MVVGLLWRGPGNIHGFVLDGKSYRQGLTTAQTPISVRRYRRDDNNVDLIRVQPHYYRVRQVEPCRRLGEVARRLS